MDRKNKPNLDEKFLLWWENSLKEQGYDLDAKTERMAADMSGKVQREISFKEIFQLMRDGDEVALVTYKVAYWVWVSKRYAN